MSGIAGIVRFDGTGVDRALIEAMTERLAYRGPDGINHWSAQNAALGHCMLHATPESLEEVQPFRSRDERYVLVMDGRIDNWESLRSELTAARIALHTITDAELVLAAYEKWGHECLSHIDGDFAFAIWDTKERALFCARDRFANKPFHYHWDGNTFAFASDLRPLLDLPWVSRVLNESLIAQFFASEWYSHDETFWQNVLRLPAAHRLQVTANGLSIKRYWEPDLFSKLPCKTDGEYIEYYRALLFESVRQRSRSHRSIACEVSGGLDSSAVFGVAHQLEQAHTLLAPRIDGYTLDFSGHPHADELVYARAVGAHLNRTIHEIKPASPPLNWYRERAARLLDFPDYPHGAMGLSILQSAAARGSRVLLSGTGGDEWLGGDLVYYAEAWQDRKSQSWLTFLRSEQRAIGLKNTIWNALRHGIAPSAPEFVKRLARQLRGQTSNDKPNFDWVAEPLAAMLRQHEATQSSKVQPRVARASQRRLLQILHYPYASFSREWNERRCAMAGLEWRQPLMSKAVVEFAFATPARIRAREHIDRWLHRKTLDGLLPGFVRNRTTKSEFMVSFEAYWPYVGSSLADHRIAHADRWVHVSTMQALYRSGLRARHRAWHVGSLWAVASLSNVIEQTRTKPHDPDD
jgi:asparagine synthase (glutamine-hydrolysing)